MSFLFPSTSEPKGLTRGTYLPTYLSYTGNTASAALPPVRLGPVHLHATPVPKDMPPMASFHAYIDISVHCACVLVRGVLCSLCVCVCVRLVRM